MPTYDIVVVGELNADLILRGDVAPVFGQVEKLIDDATLTLGSSSAIFACGAARLGLRVAFAGVVGDDEFGRFVVRQLAEKGVDTRGVKVDPGLKTGLSVILSRPADRAILTYAGSIGALRYDQIDLRLLGSTRHLHLGGLFLLDALRPDVGSLFAHAHARGVTVSLDTNYDPAERWDGLDTIFPHVDVFLPNETEACAISGQADLGAAVAALASKTVFVAVKQGAAGAMAQIGQRVFHATPIPVDVVDTTGAGDSFDAGVVYGYINGWSPERALQLGCVCGALSTRAAGGTGAQATLDEASRWL